MNATMQTVPTVQQSERGQSRADATLSLRLIRYPGPEAARAVLERLVERHEVLRSRLVPAPDGGWVQRTSSRGSMRWSDGPSAAGELLRGVCPDSSLTVVFLRDGDGAEVRVSIPATQVDLGGQSVLAAELTTLLEGQQLPQEPVQNSQYAAWQANSEETVDRERALPELFPLPDTGTEGGITHAVGFDHVARTIPRDTWAAVLREAQRLETDVEDLMLALWVGVLWKAGGDRALARAAAYFDHRRVYPDLAETVGVLSRYLPLCVKVEPDSTFGSVLERVAARRREILGVLDGFAWNELPERAHACDSRSPALPVLFACVPVSSSALAQMTSLAEPSHLPGASLQLFHDGSSARVEILSAQTRESAWLSTVLGDGFAAALAALTTESVGVVGDLPLLTPEQQSEFAARYGHAPEAVESPGRTIHDLFAEQAARTPDRLAVVDATGGWTYAQLAARGAAVAAAIAERGLADDCPVALMMNRGRDMVSAALGVWQAGHHYVPIDPAAPRDRIQFILHDSRAGVLLSDIPGAEALTSTPYLNPRLVPGSPVALPEPARVTDHAPAYMIYTSGTTGEPKGVLIEHRSAVNLALAHRARIYRHHDPDGVGLRASLNAPLAFDGAVERILLLLSGDTLFITDDETRRDPEAFVSFARGHALEVLDVTPAFLTLLLRYGLDSGADYRPRVVLVGGESISPGLWRQLAASSTAYYNVYGPTECTVNASVGRISGTRPHLGTALPNMRLHILDRGGQTVPVGVPGEIHVAGIGVARGYHDRPELTAERFRTNRYSGGDPEYARAYATGDIGSFLEDGTIAFFGRRDGQIKLRGHRIETGEIVSALCDHPAVADATVRLVSTGNDAKLVVYVAAPSKQDDQFGETLRGLLSRRLPAYMVPSAVQVLTAFPLTRNGKIDIEALPEPVPQRSAAYSTRYRAAQTNLQETLVRVWEQVLETDGIGIDDPFFEVGGHSLLVPVMIDAVRRELGVSLPVRTIFTAPTIAAMSLHIDPSQPA